MVARLNDSFQERDLVASRLQCSVARIWIRWDRRAASSAPEAAWRSEIEPGRVGPGALSIDMLS
jgi:hypothetical protein